jgi:hypothetical protein
MEVRNRLHHTGAFCYLLRQVDAHLWCERTAAPGCNVELKFEIQPILMPSHIGDIIGIFWNKGLK